MDAAETVYRDAVEFVDAGSDSFSELTDHLLASSMLEEILDLTGADGVDTLTDILESTGELHVDQELDCVLRTDEFLDGLVLAHRLTSEELGSGLVEAAPDLDIMFLFKDLSTVDGKLIELNYNWYDEEKYHDDGSLEGPAGWLEGYAPGDLLTFTYTSDGVQLSSVKNPGDGGAETAALTREFQTRHDQEPGIGFHVTLLVDKAMTRQRSLFRAAVPPIRELFAAASLEIDGRWVGRSGEEWEPAYVGGVIAGAIADAKQEGLEDCCLSGLETVLSYTMGRQVPPDEVNAALTHGAVVPAFEDWWTEFRGFGDDRLGELFGELIEAGGRALRGTRYLMAMHHDARETPLEAESQLEQAIAEDPEFGPALSMLAGYASDRGDLRRAISLWRRSGEDPDDGPIPFHEGLETPFDAVGRNDPCPCGSGKKFKQCHLDKPVVTDGNRVTWMLNKLGRYLTAYARLDAVLDLVDDAVGVDFDDGYVDEYVMDLWGDIFIMDIAVFEDGLFEDFIAGRSDLLPAEETAIYREWSHQRLRCWEVTATDDAFITLRDTASGDTIDVPDRTAASDLSVGELLLTRVLPAFDAYWLPSAVLRIDLALHDEVLLLLDNYPTPEVWVGWYDTIFDPPIPTTFEDDPMIISSGTVRPVSDWRVLERFLDVTYEPMGDGWWDDINRPENDEGGGVVRGWMHREGDALEIETYTAERLDRILDTIGDYVEVIERTEWPFDLDEPFDYDDSFEPLLPGDPVELSGEQRARIIEGMEDRWLDESVPALGGFTPREAAADPIRREDLVSLLREFDRMSPPEGAMTFDIDSLRRKLGIPE